MTKTITSDDNITSFLTNVGLITTNGPFGYNVMSCEWTHQISYDPPLVALAIRSHKATYQNIIATKVFGVNIASEQQNVLSATAGNRSAKNVDKIKMLEEMGIKFYKAENIDVLMVKDACLNAECKLIDTKDIGDHPLLIGQIVAFQEDHAKKPLIYHQGKYWKLGDNIPKPGEELLNKISKLNDKYQK